MMGPASRLRVCSYFSGSGEGLADLGLSLLSCLSNALLEFGEGAVDLDLSLLSSLSLSNSLEFVEAFGDLDLSLFSFLALLNALLKSLLELLARRLTASSFRLPYSDVTRACSSLDNFRLWTLLLDSSSQR